MQLSFDFVTNLKHKSQGTFATKMNRNLSILNRSSQRKLEEVQIDQINVEYIQKELVEKVLANDEQQYMGFSTHKTDDDEIEIYYQVHDQNDHPLGEAILIFEVKFEERNDKKLIVITNTDEKKYIQFASTHAQFSRTLMDVENSDDLYQFMSESFTSMKNLLPHFQSGIKEFINHNLVPFLQEKNFEVNIRKRIFQPHYETSEVLDVSGVDGKKYLEIIIYNVDQFFLGVQIVSRNKILEIKLPKKNLSDSFEMNKDKFVNICPDISELSHEQINEIFGLTFEEKKKLIFEKIQNDCPGFIDNAEYVTEYPADSFKMDVSNLECPLGKTKIYVEEINNAYLQYMYVIFDNEFFRSGYMISPLSQNFTQTFNDITTESIDEIIKISHLQSNALDIQEPTFELVQKQIEDAASAADVQIECGDVEDNVITCKMDDYPITMISNIEISGIHYFKVQFIKKPQKNQKAIKVLNELKIPVDNGFNLHERIFEVAKNFYNLHKLRI